MPWNRGSPQPGIGARGAHKEVQGGVAACLPFDGDFGLFDPIDLAGSRITMGLTARF